MKKKIFGIFSVFEACYLAVALAVMVLSFVVGTDKNVLSLVTAIVGVFGFLFQAKGLFYAPIVNMVYAVVYACLSYINGYYGEVITCIFVTFPICILCIISWLKNRSKKEKQLVKVNKITKTEYLILIPIVICFWFAMFFLLRALNTNSLIISTFSVTFATIAAYLALRRCSFYALFYMLADTVVIALWLFAVIGGSAGLITILLGHVVYLVNDTYGFINWSIRAKRQGNDEKEVSNDNAEIADAKNAN